MKLKLFAWCLILNVHIFFLIVINAKNIEGGDGGPPVIKEHPKSIVARRNSPVTLNCAATGSSEVRWFRDGRRVVSTRQNTHSHRMVLPDGSLFFLRAVAANKRHGDGDAGVYWCVASNRRGVTRSRNATLSIAFLDQFAAGVPTVVTGTVGATTVLHCRPPRGLPRPRVRWRLRGVTVQYDDRVYADAAGDLIFDGVNAGDVGAYVCEASNLAGSQKSAAINLEVKEPYSPPSTMARTVQLHENAVLPCNIQHGGGQHANNVTWKKRDGKMPIDRSQIVANHALHIANVAFSDSGEYFCELANHNQFVTANVVSVTLTVHQKPHLLRRSSDQLAAVGAGFNVSCNITGTPQPLVIWKVSRAGAPSTYLLPGQQKGTVWAINSTQLRVTNANRSDTGTYSCWGINSSSAVMATAAVTVLQTFPPPLMGVKPQDLGRREGSVATFPCEASTEYLPANITWWYRNDTEPTDVRVLPSDLVSVLPIGALVIRNVSAADAGIYTCMVASAAGSVREEAILTIDNQAIGSHPIRYVPRPAPPSKPVAVSVTDTSIHISWKPNSKRSSPADDVKYSINMWTSPWSEWRLVASGLLEESYEVTGLSAHQPYLFVVKSISEYGSESFPSPWSDVISTSGGEVVDRDERQHTFRRLSKVRVVLLRAKAISAGTVDLSWEVRGEIDKPINTFAVYLIQDSTLNRFVVFVSSSTYRLTDLRPDSSLDILIAPIIGKQEGTPSNSLRVQNGYTIDLHATPRNIKATNFASGYLVTWQNPTSSRFHTVGYKVLVMAANGSTYHYTTNETSIKLNPRAPTFSVKVALVSPSGGQGAWSEPKTFRDHQCCGSPAAADGETMPSVLYSPFHPAWFLYLLIPTALFVALLSLMYLRYVRRKSPPSRSATVQMPSATPVYYTDAKNSFAGRVGHKTHVKSLLGDESVLGMTQKSGCHPLVAEYAEPRSRYDDAEPRCRYDDTEPYATTALLAPPPIHVTNTHRDAGDFAPLQQQNLRINWSTLLPPPPLDPPPVDTGPWTSPGQPVGGCDHCCQHDAHVYQHPCNALAPIPSRYIVPYSPFHKFTSLQATKRPETFILETKSSTH